MQSPTREAKVRVLKKKGGEKILTEYHGPLKKYARPRNKRVYAAYGKDKKKKDREKSCEESGSLEKVKGGKNWNIKKIDLWLRRCRKK